ncbi:MAG TPA: glycerol-3-phosphate acyltransferase [Anaerolineales bacterium]|nr:glycerol-3-phosphate acyltransferase [Anaerolineales bacterium]
MGTLDWLILLAAYLLGSIPSAHIAARALTADDIHDMGDGNMGAKNTFHSVGRIAGVVVAIVDVGKGALAVMLAHATGASETVTFLAGVCVVLGHDFPVTAGFRGGQGMATILGVSFVLFPRETAVAMAVLAVVLLVTHNWNVSCAAAFVVLVGTMILTGQALRRLLYPFVLLPTIAVRKLMQHKGARHATV